MRLLNVQTFKLHTFYGDKIPSYAILSHTWLQDDEEVTFAHLQTQAPIEWTNLPGARKIKLTCQQAAHHGYSWAWIDTCCIDKSNSSELSEAINSMFRWYKRARECYVYLADIDFDQQDNFLRSRWWTRAWTLQELLAPKCVQFYDKHWRSICTKFDTAELIAKAMDIDIEVLRFPETMRDKSVAQRMSWAARRRATRAEDLAYSLLGIFQINMTMQYGEGMEAFVRMQKGIMRTTDDLSLFAWGFNPATLEEMDSQGKFDTHLTWKPLDHRVSSNYNSEFGLFAPHPASFIHCQDIEIFSQHASDAHAEEQHGSMILYVPMISSESHVVSPRCASFLPSKYWIALLPCGIRSRPHSVIGLLIQRTQLWTSISTHRLLFQGRTANTKPVITTFLVGSEDIIKAKSTRIRVDTVYRGLRDKVVAWKHAVHRKLLIKIQTEQISSFTVSGGDGGWRFDEKEHCVLLMTYEPWYSKTLDQLPSHTELILRFSARISARTLYIFLQMRNSPNGVDRIAMHCGFSSDDQVASQLGSKAQWSGALWKDSHTSLQFRSKTKPLFAKIETRAIYNQTISTLTITEHKNSVVVHSGSGGAAESD